MKAQTDMDQVMEAIRPLAQKLANLDMQNNPILYKEWLSQTYFFVCHLLRITGGISESVAHK